MSASRAEHDARPSLFFTRSGRKGIFDRFTFIPGLYARVGRPERLRVLYDEAYSLTRILDEECSSESILAEGIGDPEVDLRLTVEQIKWLYSTLGSLIERWNDGRLE
jgi:hypothetical protein